MKISVLVVMGVSGSGKTTLAAMLAGRLGWEFADADDFHSPGNVAKMHAGHPLTDEDRKPWLASIAGWIDAVRDGHGGGVVTCSALRRSYRTQLTEGRPDVRIVYLDGNPDLIAERQAGRHHHYMPASLMASQFATLERPGVEENPIVVDVSPPPAVILDAIIRGMA